MNWKKWLHGLGAAVIGGAATSIGGAIGASLTGQDVLSPAFWKIAAGCVIGGALTNAAAYLRKSPLPDVPPLNFDRIEPPK